MSTVVAERRWRSPTTRLRAVMTELEQANAELDVGVLTASERAELRADYARVAKLAGYGVAKLADDDPVSLARTTGTSVGEAKATIETSQTLERAPELDEAMRRGEVSLPQAAEIAKAEASAPGSAGALLHVAREESFHVLKERARKLRLEVEQHRGLAERHARPVRLTATPMSSGW